MQQFPQQHFGIDASAPLERISRLERQVARERQARLAAEAIAERGLRDLYESQRRLTLIQRVTDAANQASDIHAALEFAVREICTHMDWDFGNAYLAQSGRAELTAAGCWFAAQPDMLFPMVECSRHARFVPGEELPGIVLQEGQARWIDEVASFASFPRATLARRIGLASGCAFPILLGDNTAGILEFFARKPIGDRQNIGALMSQICTQLARVLERDNIRQTLLHDALHDSLTGLGNRVFLAQRGEHASAMLPDDGKGIALLTIDLDGFKTVNDRYGHQAGDTLLSAVAQRLVSCLEEQQASHTAALTPWQDACAARVGGDEFVALVEGFASLDVLDRLAASIHAALVDPFLVGAEHVRVGASIGIACSDHDHREMYQIMRDADLALYKAKADGRGTTVWFTEALGEIVRSRALLEQELRAAISEQQFVLHYQPIIDMERDGHISGFEALIRWQHPIRGLLPPSEFVPVAEANGLIVFIGDWVLETACKALARLHEGLASHARPFISINIAPQQFLQPCFAARVRDVLMSTGIDPATLKLEVTEGAAISDPERTGRVLAEIREWGVHTSLDDFGTGYSSLSYLQRLPFDSLKIDRSFVTAIGNEQSRSIVGAILSLAATMNMSVVAEGIESHEQRLALEAMGCQLGQGYLYSRPLTEVDAFAIFMQTCDEQPTFWNELMPWKRPGGE